MHTYALKTHYNDQKCIYSQVPDKSTPAYYFSDIFPTLRTLLRSPRLLISKKLTFFTNPSFHFLSFSVLLTPNFPGKIAYCCIYLSFILYDNLFLFFPSLYHHLNHLLEFQPHIYSDPPLLHFRNLSDPLIH